MKKITLLLTLFAVLAIASSCNTQPEGLFSTQLKVIKVETESTESPSEALVQSLHNAHIKFYDKELALLTDSGNYRTAAYKYNDAGKSLSLKFPGQDAITFVVDDKAAAQADKNWIVLKGSTKAGAPVKIVLEPNDHYEYEDTDQLKPAANAWRLKPTKNQSKEEIKKKVIAQLDYMIAYFNMAIKREDRTFNVKHLNAPLDFYANGLAFKDYEPLAQWRNIFYDDEDASKGLELLIKAMKSMKEYPADKKSYTQGYANALSTMKAYLEI